MMMMDELTLTWHIVLRLQGHVTVKKESRIVDAVVDCTSRYSCMSERKARSSVYHEKLAYLPGTHPPAVSPRVGSGQCRISPPRFLAECCKRQLNQVSFVLLYFRLSTFSDLY